jgi:hypothetical protein
MVHARAKAGQGPSCYMHRMNATSHQARKEVRRCRWQLCVERCKVELHAHCIESQQTHSIYNSSKIIRHAPLPPVRHVEGALPSLANCR